ncbi:MAG: hypothetical protein H0V23_04530 [Nocardioidaceae bacterium]|nr:hypothetical protein [Nocardioidaceae bacterium]
MSTRQRVRRTLYAAIACVCGAVFITSAGWLTIGGFSDVDSLLIAVWGSGLASLGFVVAACGVEDDSTDDPAYFTSIVQGLREEWQRLGG